MFVQLVQRLRRPLAVMGILFLHLIPTTAEAQIFNRLRDPYHPHRYCPPVEAHPYALPPGKPICPPTEVHPPIQTEPPVMPKVEPTPPTTEPSQPDTTPPETVPQPQPEPEPETSPFLDSPEFGGEAFAALGGTTAAAAAAGSPNMFGDQFGMGGGQSTMTVMRAGVLNGTPANFLFNGATFGNGIYAWDSAGTGATLTFISDTSTQMPTVTGKFIQPGPPVTTGQDFDTPSSEAVTFINGLVQPGGAVFAIIEGDEQNANSNVRLSKVSLDFDSFVTIGPEDTAGAGPRLFPLDYGVILNTVVVEEIPIEEMDEDIAMEEPGVTPPPGQVMVMQVVANVPNPAGGGGVGRRKLSENANPLPRDRFIFEYDFFSNTTLTPGGWDVNRFAVGVEKTFFNRNSSIEIIFPFAGTLNSDFTFGAESSNTEAGNLLINLKNILFRADPWYFGGGLGLSLPTADDTRVFLPNGTPLIRIKNETVLLAPYAAVLWTPSSRFFSQAWITFQFDAGGNPTFANVNFNGLQHIGSLDDQTFMFVDWQAGYWLVQAQDPTAFLRGLAPFLELHYTGTLNDADIIASNGFVVGDFSNRRDELNLSAGVVAQFGNNINCSVGCVTPLRDDGNRSFDLQIGARLNVFYGPTAAERNFATYIP